MSESTLASVAKEAARAAVSQLFTAEPGLLQSYDPTQQRATVKPVVCRKLKNGDGTFTCEPQQPVPSCPVYFPSGGGGLYAMTFPVEAGDPGIMVYSGRDYDGWLATGEDNSEAQSNRRHSAADAFFLPGHRPFVDPLPEAAVAADGWVLYGPKFYIGDSSASKAVLHEELLSDLADAFQQTQVLMAAVAIAVPAVSGAVTTWSAAIDTFRTALAGSGFKDNAVRVKG